MSKKCRRLCAADRKVIYNMNKAGSSQEAIAEAIGFSQSTISKELSRNRGGKGYRPVQADRMSQERQAAKSRRPRLKKGSGYKS